MTTDSARRQIAMFAGLAALLVATRFNHFSAIPDASWAVFFAGGYALRQGTRWAFPLLMALAVGVDYLVIRLSGLSFWEHYCVSAGYWMLLPAYFSLWLGGMWTARQAARATPAQVAVGAPLALVVAVAVCHLFAQGGFYWMTDAVADKSVAGWAKNYSDWLLPYMATTAGYVAVLTMLRAGWAMLARQGHAART